MRTALSVGVGIAIGLLAMGAADLRPGTLLFSAKPARPHVTLGPVQVLALPGPDEAPVPLTEAARARYGDVDALVEVRSLPLPWADAALVRGIAIRWD